MNIIAEKFQKSYAEIVFKNICRENSKNTLIGTFGSNPIKAFPKNLPKKKPPRDIWKFFSGNSQKTRRINYQKKCQMNYPINSRRDWHRSFQKSVKVIPKVITRGFLKRIVKKKSVKSCRRNSQQNFRRNRNLKKFVEIKIRSHFCSISEN